MIAVVAVVVAVLGSPDDWGGVEFRQPQFDQAVAFARERLLDPPEAGSLREKMAWRKAADQALWSLDPTAELVPDGALSALRGPADRHGHYSGESAPLTCGGKPLPGLRIFRISAEVERLEGEDPKDVRVARQKARDDALDAAWQARFAKEPFGRAEMTCALDWLQRQLPPAKAGERQPAYDLAWVNAASGWLKAVDRNADVIAQRFWERVSEGDQVAEVGDPGLSFSACAEPASAWCVADVRPGSAAWKADVRVRDRIESVGGEAIDGAERKEVWQRLSGPPRTVVKVRIVSAQGGKARDLKLARDLEVFHDVQATAIEPGVVHVRLRDFVHGTASRLGAALEGALKPSKGRPVPLAGMILDLRGNPGGILDEAIVVADGLLAKGAIVRTRWRTRSVDREATASPEDLTVPVVVVVDKRCASACEILTGALQDNLRGPVIGGRTFGKASMQEVKRPNLMAGYYVKVTIGRYLTPASRDLDHTGATPDIALPAEATASFVEVAEPWRPAAACVARHGQAAARIAADVAPRRRPDPWLEMARDWLACLAAPSATR